jgi:hypothetical protein
MAQFHFITVVWGDRYTESFLDVILPSQLSSGNLPAFRKDGVRATYKVFTTTRDAERIRRAPVYDRLSGVLPVEFTLIDDVLVNQKHEAMTECHRRAIRAAKGEGAILIFLAPDLIFSDGSFRRLREISETGKRVVILAGIRVVKETFVPWFLSRFDQGDRCSITLPARELVKNALNHLHPFTQSCFWDSPQFSRWPSNIYWAVGGEGYVARGYHFHPLMVHPVRKDLEPSSTIDDEYLALACPDLNDWHVVQDSDDILIVDITDRAQFADMLLPRRASEFRVAFWAQVQARPHHRLLSRYDLRFHTGDLSPEWKTVENLAKRTMTSVESYLKHPFLYFGWKRIFRSLGYGLKRPLEMILGKNRIERLRSILGM